MDLEEGRVYYDHDANCSRDNFEEPNVHGIKRCKDCSGLFDANGKGISVTDFRMDEWRN